MKKSLVFAAALAVVSFSPAAFAHCDSYDGPVIKSALKSLETGKLGPLLAWVKPAGEAEVKAAFQKSLAVRKLGPEAKELADRSFLETLVRVHRAGEGAPYTGLKPAGTNVGPAAPAADKAIESGSSEALAKMVSEHVRAGITKRFATLKGKKGPGEDIAAGREWVEAYVGFVHYVEGLHQAAQGPAEAHGHGDSAAHHD
ncbi:MAG: DUF6448 family protein [Myxococcaceae bacterium]